MVKELAFGYRYFWFSPWLYQSIVFFRKTLTTLLQSSQLTNVYQIGASLQGVFVQGCDLSRKKQRLEMDTVFMLI